MMHAANDARTWRRRAAVLASLVPALLLALLSAGCTSLTSHGLALEGNELLQPDALAGDPAMVDGAYYADNPGPPRELDMVSLPEYRLAPPDVVLIEVPLLLPKPPYYIKPGDVLRIAVTGTPETEPPILGDYLVNFDGTVTLGPSYEPVRVAGLTQAEATDGIAQSVQRRLGGPLPIGASVAIIQVGGLQAISDQHLVQPDGYITLGMYGRVYVQNMTLPEAKVAIEKHLSQYLLNPVVSIDLFALNSKFYYVVQENPILGDAFVPLPITGSDTVLKALAQVGGLGQVASKKIWIARPTPAGTGCAQILPVDIQAITRHGDSSTNYQLLPGDRLVIGQDRMIALDAVVQRVLNPFERMLGFSFLGAQTVQILQRFPEGRIGF